MEKVDKDFRDRIYALVASIPKGRVMSYGQIAALTGDPRAARIVGGIAHWGDPDLPWQRVVMKNGGLATGYPGGIDGHRVALETEGVSFDPEGRVNMPKHLWNPDKLSF